MSVDKINYDHITFTLKEVVWMNSQTGEITSEKQNERDREVFCLKDSKGGTWWAERTPSWMRLKETPKDQHYRIIQKPTWYKREVGGYKRGIERNDFRKKLEFDIIPKIVRHYEIVKGLEGDAKDTWSDILS
jgi:hypothetical protein